MNLRFISRVLGLILLCLAALMLLPLFVGLLYGENVLNFLIPIAVSAVSGLFLTRFKPRSTELFAREGFIIVGLGWILLSLLGALPYVISGSIPSYVDALFETVSGFTTTGATILRDFDNLPRSEMFWRLFTHWIGGMGVLVFVMAVLPMSGEHSMHIMRAEIPGPTVGKLVPRARQTALILYLIYVVLTIINTVFLIFGGMSFYDALLHAFATAGTGGFSTRSSSIGEFHNPYIEIVTATFMLLFGINFNLFFLLLLGRVRDVVKNEELRWYLCIIAVAVVILIPGLAGSMGLGEAARHAYFIVTSVISTTCFTIADYTLWPSYCQWIILLLMFMGACACSTGGGLKISRFATLIKSVRMEVRQVIRPRGVYRVQMDGRRVDAGAVRAISVFFVLYVFLILLFTFLISFDGHDIATNFSAALACLSNTGLGVGLVGPSGSFNVYSDLSKLFLSLAMLFGRLEIYPILVLFSVPTWKN